MKKAKIIIVFSVIAMFSVIMAIVLVSIMPRLEKRTWVLSYAQQIEAPYSVVANDPSYDFSDDKSGIFDFSKPTELTLEAKDGKLILTDKTNEKIYEGTYTVKSGKYGKIRALKKKEYSVVIDGMDGTAQFINNQTLLVTIDGYHLHFEVQ